MAFKCNSKFILDQMLGCTWSMLRQRTYSFFTSFYRDHDGKVTPEEVAAAAAYLKDTIGKEGVQELISNLSKDKGAYTHGLPLLLMTFHARFFSLTNSYACRWKDPCGRHSEAGFSVRGKQ
jgi:hypothetical protein